jgi:hypothetical protein
MTRHVILDLISQATALASVFFLFYASTPVPDDMASWDGNSEEEKRWRRKRRILAWALGFPYAVASIGCQTFKTLWP